MKRRTFLKTTLAVGTTLSLGCSRVLGANDDVRVATIGIGSFVKIGGKGRGDVRDFRKIAGVRVVGLCDCDTKHLGYERDQFAKRNEPVKTFVDFRKLLDDREIDAVTITTPNHWHALMTIMACQAGKDVFVQKPASHNLFEGRKMVEAARKYKRIVQTTHSLRNSGAAEEAFEYARAGKLGKVLCAHGINYKPRMSIGKVDGPRPTPATCDYDLWCGPAPKKPLMREYLHYDWHWDWDTGDGDLGNMGIHFMDGCRWGLGQNELPKRVVSIGGRLAYDDDGQTPNTLITLLDYEPAPLIFEVRGLPKDASYRQGDWRKSVDQTMDTYRGVRTGSILRCEGGHVSRDTAYDNDGRPIEKFTRNRVSTKQNFIDCVRSRRSDQLTSESLEGHLSCGLVHLANISYRIGRQATPDAIREAIGGEPQLAETFARLEEHLAANRIDLAKESLVLGPVLTMDPRTERFVGAFSKEANALISREYREPFVVGEHV
ncbi:MAG: Gfo/Idh/MocA family oxidoreductase [Candidatus Nealsonbacteria bacterium]|nr:Gfo/Idh/MocA family oxidoreductase [Candidatus Nealsonbacteria bacterium]